MRYSTRVGRTLLGACLVSAWGCGIRDIDVVMKDGSLPTSDGSPSADGANLGNIVGESGTLADGSTDAAPVPDGSLAKPDGHGGDGSDGPNRSDGNANWDASHNGDAEHDGPCICSGNQTCLDDPCCQTPKDGSSCTHWPLCGCGAGQVCQPNDSIHALSCVTTDNLPEGADCTAGVCAAGLGCFSNLCKRYCNSETDCTSVGGVRRCYQTVWSDDSVIPGVKVCGHVCDPVHPQSPEAPLRACPAGFGCSPLGDGASYCIPAGSGGPGVRCSVDSDCLPGHYCTVGNMCNAYCRVDTDCATGACSPTFNPPLAAGSNSIGYCTASNDADAGPDAGLRCPKIELLVNGTFDANERLGAGWTMSSLVSNSLVTARDDAQSPRNVGWLGGKGQAVEVLSQTITLPSSYLGASLSFYYRILTDDTAPPDGGTPPGGTLDVTLTDTSTNQVRSLKSLSSWDRTNTWRRVTASVDGAWAGHTVVLSFTAKRNGSASTTFYVDTISMMTIGCAPLLSFQTDGDGFAATTPTLYLGQTFLPTSTVLNGIRVGFREVGNVGPIRVELQPVGATASSLASWSVDVPGASAATPFLLLLDPPLAVKTDAKYRIVVIPNASATVDTLETYWLFKNTSPAPYAQGQAQISINSGGTWTDLADQGSKYVGTFYFQTF